MRLNANHTLKDRLLALRQRRYYSLLAFCIPFFFFLMVMLVGGYSPFSSDRSLLYSDMYHQYYPFFVDFRDHLRAGDSLVYNWDIGMGLDYVALIAYYLGSPLNLFSVIVPDSLVLEYFSLLTPIKLGLASLFFSIMLRKLFDRNDISIALFGSMYGLCSWALGYQWNIMWLDTFALLPLVVLGTVSVLRDRKFLLYTISLALSVVINYYIGLFVCIFVLLLCLVYEICRFESIGKLFADFGLMVLFSALAIGMTAIVTYPAFIGLQGTQSNVNQFPEKFSLNIVDRAVYADYFKQKSDYELAASAGNFGEAVEYGLRALWTALKAIFAGMKEVAGNIGGGVVPTFKEGLPNIYCGIGAAYMASLFLFNRKFRVRDKLCSVGLLLFFMLSFLLRQLDYIWHGFHFTNMIPYRFSFLFSFVLLFMAYRLWLERDSIRLWHIPAALAPIVPVVLFAEIENRLVYLTFNFVFLALYIAALLLPRMQRKPAENASEEETSYHKRITAFNRRASTISLAVIILLELAFSTVNFGTSFPYTSITNYPSGLEHTESIVRYMHEREDELFFRAEVTHAQTLNDGALNHYHGISTFTSSANVAVTEFTKELGLSAKNTYNRYCYENGSPVTNLFLNLKYLIERGGKKMSNMFFEEIHHYGNAYLYENQAYLPLGFLANSDLQTINFKTTGDAFYFQNRLLKLASGIKDDAWVKLNGQQLEITGHGATILNSGSSGYASYRTDAAEGSVVFTFTASHDGLVCLNLSNLSKTKNYSVSINGLEQFSETYSLPQLLAIGDVKKGDTVSVRFKCSANTEGSISASAAVLLPEVFWDAYSVLNASTLHLTVFEDTLVEGTINCNRDGLLYTSIPQNGNWKAYIDGQEAEITLIGDCMIALPITEGYHKITFQYENKALFYGAIISLACVLSFAAIAVTVYRQRFKKGKYLKQTDQRSHQ